MTSLPPDYSEEGFSETGFPETDACLLDPYKPELSGIELEQLLHRSDIWRGDSRNFVARTSVDSGFPALNTVLLNEGWPTQALIEICQKGLHQQEWLLFSKVLTKTEGYIVLLNPPAMPFCQALIQAGIDLDRVIVVQVTNKADFLASFVELARTESCEVLLAWQPKQSLTYTELRKCLLASNENTGLCVLIRPEAAYQQASPATLRLLIEIRSTDLYVQIFKQKGYLQHSEPVSVSLPKAWKGFLPYHLLDQINLPGHSPAKRKSGSVIPMRRGKR
ncbi:MAG: diguanylate cyclase [Gammaproteobacteria bacterium]|nr:MAG: diguanylate cyclase [Gammaproteobacteria bacterium]